MSKIRIAAFFGLAILLSLGATVQRTESKPRAPKFSSLYTDLNKECKGAVKESELNEGSDMPLKCKGYGGYYIYIYYSALASQIAVQMQGNEDVSIGLGMQELNYSDQKGRKVEWRMADGKPFAVILRVSNYKGEAREATGDPFDPKYKTGESLVVRGLKGYEKIDFTVDAKTTPNPNEKARQMADENYGK
ncbi:MAG TPA: hypothetical protein VGC66_24840 [Pyrinomonadaceae bacterium]|jgi:hypothetical protein